MLTDTTELTRELSLEFARRFPDEAAARLESVALDEVLGYLTGLPAAPAARLVARLAPDLGGRIVGALPPRSAARIVENLEPQLAARLLTRSDDGPRTALLAELPADLADELRELVAYPPQTAGALMDPRVLALGPQVSVEDALRRLRSLRDKRIHRVYLTDPDQRLLGSVSIRDLALAEPETRLEQLDSELPVGVRATAGYDEVVETLGGAGGGSLPVVDLDGRILGVLRQSELVQAAREDATVNLQSMVGAGKEERALSKVSLAVRKRLPWLQVNLATAFLAASVVGLFESTIASYTALAVLLPVVAGQSGNTGAQALAVTMRGLALREIRTRNWKRVCFKETRVGAINGVAVALTTSIGVLIWSRSVGLALVIAGSMIISMIAAGLSGAAVPLVLTTIGQDPAQSSSIILTTVTDIVGFFSFLGIATIFMSFL